MDESARDLYRQLDDALTGAASLLDVGCGRGAHLVAGGGAEIVRDFRRRGGHVVGVDVDHAGAQNPFLDEFHPISADGPWSLPAASADVVFSDWVLEHVVDAANYFSECARVMRPGARLVARTMQRWSVAGIGARLVPDRYHQPMIKRLQPGMNEEDIFPTALRANTRRTLDALATAHGLELASVTTHCTLSGYAGGSARLASVLRTVESRLPTSMHHAIVVVTTKPAAAAA